jgi:hypothetical protein
MILVTLLCVNQERKKCPAPAIGKETETHAVAKGGISLQTF